MLAWRLPFLPSCRVALMAPAKPVLKLAGAARQGASRLVMPEQAAASRDDLAARMRLETAERRAQELEREVAELRGLMNLERHPNTSGTVATVLVRPSIVGERSMLIDRGRRAGVKKGAAVLGMIGEQVGVVGRVVEAGPNMSRVQTLLDPECRIAAGLDAEGGFVYAGPVDGFLGRLEFVPRDRAVRIGETVSTSADGELFPAGLLIGRVKSLGASGDIFHDILVEAALPFSSMRHVWVVTEE